MALIEVANLKKSYENEDVITHVLHGLSFRIDNGEFVAIMGPSGSGKSTLMHILGFLDRPTSGDYFFEGEDTSGFDDDKLARIRNEKVGFVFQAFNLLPRTTVIDNVKLPLVYSKQKNHEELAKKALDAVGLSHRLEYLSNQISGGEKQRVAIARASFEPSRDFRGRTNRKSRLKVWCRDNTNPSKLERPGQHDYSRNTRKRYCHAREKNHSPKGRADRLR